jgi:hypothetical protein
MLAGPTSIFNLAATGMQLRTPSTPEKNRNVMVVTRADGVVRCQVVRFAETEEGKRRSASAGRGRSYPGRADRHSG